MRFSLWTNAHDPIDTTLDLCAHVERSGWDGLWFSDHFMPNAPPRSTPTHEAWTALCGAAACVPRVRLGTLVLSVTHRHPAVLAKMAATLDQISGGRLVLGIGGGWQETEHRAYGIPFPPIRERLERLEEACRVMQSLWIRERTTFQGTYYRLSDAALEAKPLQQPLPLLIGGAGEQRTLRIAARHAQAWNIWGTARRMRRKMAVLDRHCAVIGRDPRSIQRTAATLLILSDAPEDLRRAEALRRTQPVLAGGVEAVRARVREYVDAGVDEIVIADFTPNPDRTLGPSTLGEGAVKRATLDRFIEQVAPAFR